MAYVKGQPFYPQFTDPATGLLMTSGTVEFYLTGTSTPTPYYTDSSGTSGGTSFEINLGGKPDNDVYFDTAITYKILVKNAAGTTLETIDPFWVLDAADPTSTVKSFATLAEAVADTALTLGDAINLAERTTGNGGGAMWDVVLSSTVTENTFNIVQCTGVGTLSLVLRVAGSANVKQFGATGDGTTDDTLAIEAAVDNYSNVYFPTGTYIVSENGGAACISLKDNLTIFGDGINLSIIKRVDSDLNSSRMMYGTGVNNVTIKDLTLDGNIANQDQAFEQQHAFMVTRAGGAGTAGSTNIKLVRVEAKDTVGDGFFFHLESKDCHMTDCVADNNLRVGANVGFVQGCTIKGCIFKNIRTNGIKTEPNDPGNIARNITIVGNIFHCPDSPDSTLGGVTLGSPTTAEVNGITIVGNTFYNLDFPVLLSKAAKNVVVSGNTMRNCRSMVRALSFTSALGDIQENILVENNVGYDLLHTGTTDNYLFAFYNAKNVVCRNNIATQASGGTLSRYADFRECDDVTFSGNRISGDGLTTVISFLNCEKVEVADNVIEKSTATNDIIVFDNVTAPTIPLLYAKIRDNVFLGTYRYGINLTNMTDANTISESGTKYLGTFTAKRIGSTSAKYQTLYEDGNFSITSGTGVPSGQPLGDRGLYIREDGGTTTTLYIWEGAAWVAK